MKCITILSVAVVAWGISSADAQYDRGNRGGGGGNNYYHSSTAAEGAMRGTADVMRAAGDANMSNAAAQNLYQDAYSKELDNRKKATNTYYENKAAWQSHQDQDTKLRQARVAAYQTRMAPERTGPSQLDPITGTIHWSKVLSASIFDSQREKIEEFFTQRARYGSMPRSEADRIGEAAKQMRRILADNKDSLDPADYTAAGKEITRLQFEAKYPVG